MKYLGGSRLKTVQVLERNFLQDADKEILAVNFDGRYIYILKCFSPITNQITLIFLRQYMVQMLVGLANTCKQIIQINIKRLRNQLVEC